MESASRSRSTQGEGESSSGAPPATIKAASNGSCRELATERTVEKAEVFCRACHTVCPLSCRVCPTCESAPSFSVSGDFNLKGVLKVLFDGRGGGAGASNLVMLGHNLDQDKRVVVKAARLDHDAEEVATLLSEIQIQRRLAHGNLLPLLYAAETPSEVLLVTPFAAGGDLYAALGQQGMLPEKQAARLCSQLLAGLGYLHEELSILHGDMKPRNIFLVSAGSALVAQLGDFGLSRKVPKKAPYLCQFQGLQGTSGYMAPEIIAQEDYGCSVDMFALGVIIFTILGGYEPFYPASNVSAPLEFDEAAWGQLSQQVVPFVTDLLRPLAEQRLTAVAAKAHCWVHSAGAGGVCANSEDSEKALPFGFSDLKFHTAGEVLEALAAARPG